MLNFSGLSDYKIFFQCCSCVGGVSWRTVTDLRSCWLKVCFCSEETSAEGNPGACSVSSSHWANRAGQLRFRANRTSEKCSVRLRGDVPPTAWEHTGSNAATQASSKVRSSPPSRRLTCRMVSVSRFPSRCNTSASAGVSLHRDSSSVCQAGGNGAKVHTPTTQS